jgi:PAS domain S-box-containing protein
MQPLFDPTASDAAFRDVADLLPTGLALFEDDDKCVYVNRCAADLVSRPAESLLGRGWLQIVHPDDAEDFDKVWTEARVAHSPFTYKLRVGTDDGDRHLLARSTPMPRGRWLITLDDRTSEVEAVATLRDREAEFRLLAENSTDMITRFTPDGRLLYVSPASRQLLGYDPEELIGTFDFDLIHPDDVPGASEERDAAVGGGGDGALRVRLRRKDGSWVPVEAIGRMALDPRTGEVVEVQSSVRSIEERMRAERELRVSESRFRSAFDDALVGMALTGVDGHIKTVNRTLCRMLGRTQEDLVGIHISDLTHPEDRDKNAENVKAIIAGETDGGRWDKRYLDASGQTIWVELSTSLVRDEDGRPNYFVTQIIDISARKRAEQLKDEFIATVSHELRSPLTSIQGYVELLAEQEGRPEQDVRWLEVIGRNSHRLRRLVDDLLFIAQARAETLALDRTDVDLARVLRDAVDGTAPRAVERDVELALQAEAVVVANADADRLGQAVDNLISNALKYTPPGGRIDVRLERRGDSAAIAVADTGIGMSQEDVDRLFERFFRASTAVDNAIPGVGLGLSIVKAIVDLHGGDVAVESVEGSGTTFEILLPVGPRPPHVVAARRAAGSA